MDCGTQATSLEPGTEDSQTRFSSSSSAEMISDCDGAIVCDSASSDHIDSNLIIVVDFEFDTSHLQEKGYEHARMIQR